MRRVVCLDEGREMRKLLGASLAVGWAGKYREYVLLHDNV